MKPQGFKAGSMTGCHDEQMHRPEELELEAKAMKGVSGEPPLFYRFL
jgi:hypothetical protein